jgi:hypothetical protein
MQIMLGAQTHVHLLFEGKQSFVMTTSSSQQTTVRLTPLETRLMLCLLEEAGDPAALLTSLQCDEASWTNRKTHPSIWKTRVEDTQAYLESIAEQNPRQFKKEKQVLYDAMFRLRKKLARLGLTIHLMNNHYTLAFAQIQHVNQREL